jgi:hypothetical protein
MYRRGRKDFQASFRTALKPRRDSVDNENMACDLISNKGAPMVNRHCVKILAALLGTSFLLACSGQTEGFTGKGPDTRKNGTKSAAASGTTMEPALIPQNVAGANLTMDCFSVDAVRGDGLTNLECLFVMPPNKVYSGSVAVTEAALITTTGEKNFSTRVAPSSKGSFQSVLFEGMKVLEIPSVTALKVEANLHDTSFSGKYVLDKSIFDTAKKLDTLDPTPNLSQCGNGKPEIVDLSSNSGKCAQGSVMVFWSPNSKKMACCQLKEPSLMLSATPAYRSKECLDDEFVVGFEDHTRRKVKCGKVDTSRVELSSGTRVPALVNFGGLTGLASSLYAITSPEHYEAARDMLRAFGSSQAMGCKDEFMIRGLEDVGGNPILGGILDALTSLPDVLPRCRTLEPKVRY